jgi:hypothetical protein
MTHADNDIGPYDSDASGWLHIAGWGLYGIAMIFIKAAFTPPFGG